MQRRNISTIEQLQHVVSSRNGDPVEIALPEGSSGVLVSEGLWLSIQQRLRLTNGDSSSLEKAVSLLIQESRNAEQTQQAVARREEQFVRVFSMSLTPMRIEDWTSVKAFLDGLGQTRNPIEIKEYLQAHPEEVGHALACVSVLDCNKAFRETVDAEHNPEYLSSLEKIIPAESYPSVINLMLSLADSKADIHENIRIQRVDGGLRDVQIHMSLFSDGDSKEIKMLVSYWDVTKQKRITEHLKSDDDIDAEERSRSLLALNSISEGVITTDQRGYVINLNPTAKRITGWGLDYFQRPLQDVFQPRSDAFHSIGLLLQRCRRAASVYESDVACLLENKDGDEFWIRFTVTPIVSDDVISGYIVIFHDVSESRQLLEQIRQHKNLDPITKLLNRQAPRGRLAASINQAKNNGGHHAMLLVDLDQFHVVNDSCGHTVGDMRLTEVADLICGLVRSDGAIARIGGDEFGVLLPHCGIDAASQIANNILGSVKSYRFSYEGKIFQIGASIWVVLIDQAFRRAS